MRRLPWLIFSLCIAVLVSLPIVAITYYWFYPETETWSHIKETLLTEYAINSLFLMVGVFLSTFIIGVSTAWTVSSYDFPGRSFFQWALILPLAFPTYILGFIYVELLDFYGPVQTFLRFVMGYESKRDYDFPEIMSVWGVILVMSLVLYPYTYMIVRPVFQNFSSQFNDIATTFGYSPWKRFFKLFLPMARPAIFAGTSLALMEALNDFGTVQYYGVETFTTGIYRAWFSFGDVSAAAKLSCYLMFFILCLLFSERWQRRGVNYSLQTISVEQKLKKIKGLHAFLAIIVCALPIMLGFVIPIYQLCAWLLSYHSHLKWDQFMTLIKNSLGLALLVSVIIVSIALLLCYGVRLTQSKWQHALNKLATIGYAIPGSVISVGVLIPLVWADFKLGEISELLFQVSLGLVLSGSIFAISYGYVARFIMVAYNATESGFNQVTKDLDHAAITLGVGPIKSFFVVHFPLIKRSVLAAVILVFIDIMKELPATLILRPFNFDTLATKTFELASEEMLPHSAVYALAIVLVGLIPVVFLNFLSNTEQKR